MTVSDRPGELQEWVFCSCPSVRLLVYGFLEAPSVGFVGNV